ncbi:MAG: hypothetical protein MIN69_23980, partial [Methylorubrum extorquens]|uniref:hypothetical protein n=1 Tax=Methylorubrum extorquens TaxID=408 RepID=UPI002FEE3A05
MDHIDIRLDRRHAVYCPLSAGTVCDPIPTARACQAKFIFDQSVRALPGKSVRARVVVASKGTLG